MVLTTELAAPEATVTLRLRSSARSLQSPVQSKVAEEQPTHTVAQSGPQASGAWAEGGFSGNCACAQGSRARVPGLPAAGLGGWGPEPVKG